MKIISWNVNGLRANIGKEFHSHIESLSPDVVCLQETKAQDDQVAQALSPMTGWHIYSNSAEKKAILVWLFYPKQSLYPLAEILALLNTTLKAE